MARRYNYYGYYYPESQPVQTDQGIKAKSKRGSFAKNWWATRWIKSLEKLVNAGRLTRGRRYARQGQVLSISETKGGIAAQVQGSGSKPYQVSIKLDTLTDKQWTQVIDALAGQAIFTAQLLAGEMPQEIEGVFTAAGVSLFPQNKKELQTFCNCPDPQNPCKHVAAVHYLLGEQFDDDPFLLFRLRGRTAEQIMEAIQAQQGAELEDEVEEIIPLDEQLDHFWEMGQPLARLETVIKSPRTSLPLLKRLGQPSFLQTDLLTLLGPAYKAMTAKALRTAFAEDDEEE